MSPHYAETLEGSLNSVFNKNDELKIILGSDGLVYFYKSGAQEKTDCIHDYVAFDQTHGVVTGWKGRSNKHVNNDGDLSYTLEDFKNILRTFQEDISLADELKTIKEQSLTLCEYTPVIKN